MKFRKLYAAFLVLFFIILFSPFLAHAHEQYVLTSNEINADLAAHGPSVWSALKNPMNLNIAFTVALCSLVGFILYFLWQYSKWGQEFERLINKLEPLGHVVLRFALAASLIASANFNSFLGPEIPLTSIPYGMALKFAMYILGVMLILGLWTEIVGFVALMILVLATCVYKDYMTSYINYLGEFLALIIFGSRTFSVDRALYGIKAWAKKYEKYELALIRITYGISVMYPAIIYKMLHPEVIVDIVNRYNLTQFHWLFPHNPLLISLGSGLAQIVVGICLIFGFETRLNTLITFTLMILSVLFFKEAVWPHWILLALAFYLIINNGGEWSLDHYIQNKIEQRRVAKLRNV